MQATDVLRWILAHPANRGRRTSAVLRAVRFQVYGRLLQRPTRVRIGRQAVMTAYLHSHAASKAVYANPPDFAEMNVWTHRLRPGDLFVDVGANVGVYALWVADLGAQVIAVEPGPKAARRLRENVAMNTLPIEVIEAALTATSGTVSFDDAGDTTAHLGGPLTVRAMTLDELLGDHRAAGVKIDVEGAERLVLEGSASALADQRIGCLQLEWNACSEERLGETRTPVAELLARHGYDLFRPDRAGCLHPTDGAYGSDVFALPDGRVV
jgi:FkbM family methyltransferase